jgi:hypothetical protein
MRLQRKLLPEEEIAPADGLDQTVSGIGLTIAILAAGAIAEAADPQPVG